MLTYCVLKNSKSNDIEVVETGFSFLAFVFGPFWGFLKKLWLFSFIGLIILLGLLHSALILLVYYCVEQHPTYVGLLIAISLLVTYLLLICIPKFMKRYT